MNSLNHRTDDEDWSLPDGMGKEDIGERIDGNPDFGLKITTRNGKKGLTGRPWIQSGVELPVDPNFFWKFEDTDDNSHVYRVMLTKTKEEEDKFKDMLRTQGLFRGPSSGDKLNELFGRNTIWAANTINGAKFFEKEIMNGKSMRYNPSDPDHKLHILRIKTKGLNVLKLKDIPYKEWALNHVRGITPWKAEENQGDAKMRKSLELQTMYRFMSQKASYFYSIAKGNEEMMIHGPVPADNIEYLKFDSYDQAKDTDHMWVYAPSQREWRYYKNDVLQDFATKAQPALDEQKQVGIFEPYPKHVDFHEHQKIKRDFPPVLQALKKQAENRPEVQEVRKEINQIWYDMDK